MKKFHYIFKKKKSYEPNTLDKDSDSDDNEIEVKSHSNHIYFYSAVTNKSAQQLNIILKEIEEELLNKYKQCEHHREYIYLHINSYGGSIFSSFSIIDTIKNLKIPVISIIEGTAASAASLISIVCDYRIIYQTSYMLIHQLSSMTWGKMSEIEEEVVNLKELMKQIKILYKTYSDIPESEIEELLKHDLWWNAEICLEKGLVDELKTTARKYPFVKEHLDI